MINKVLPTKIDLDFANVLTVMVCFFHSFQSTSSLIVQTTKEVVD